MTITTNRPLAAPGLISYRYLGAYGWIMIGAKDDTDALNEAQRSTGQDTRGVNLQVWKASGYVAVRIYHIEVVNEKTGRRVTVTGYPMPHAQCMTMISKMTQYPWRRIQVVEV